MVTAGGVAFLSGTLDYYLRAYDVSTGRELWKARLPAGGRRRAMTYQSRSGRQMVVVVAGGHGSLGTKAGIQSSLMPCRAARIAAFITGTPAMAAIGRYNSLQIVKHTGFGLYLDGGPDGEILLPNRYIPRMCRPSGRLAERVCLPRQRGQS